MTFRFTSPQTVDVYCHLSRSNTGVIGVDRHRYAVMRRFFWLATMRVLQRDWAADVRSVRAEIYGGPACNGQLGPVFTALRNAGAVEGEDGGRDERGFTYKRWKVINAASAQRVVNEQHIKPMTREVMERWRELSVSSG